MSKEIIDLLEKARYDVAAIQPIDRIDQINRLINQALNLLKQQPTAGEFTKELRIMATQIPYLELGGFDLPKYAGNLISAADHLDRAEAINKDLLATCEMGLNAMRGLLALADMMKPHWERRDSHISHIKIIEVAIAKAQSKQSVDS